jgi:hypothetical protein
MFQEEVSSPAKKYARINFLNKNYKKGFLIEKKRPKFARFRKKNLKFKQTYFHDKLQ